MRLVVVKLVTFFFFFGISRALIDSICTPSVSYQYNLHHCIAHQCTVILVRASSDSVQHFAFVFVQIVRGSGSSCLKEVGSGLYYLKEVDSRSGRVENNACRCVPGGISRGYRDRNSLGHVCVEARLCISIYKTFIYISDSGITV